MDSLLSLLGFNGLFVFWMKLLHGSWSLLEVILFNFIISQGFNMGSVSLLSLAKLLVVLLLSGNGLSLSDVIFIIVHRLLLSHRLDSVLVTIQHVWLLLMERS